MSAAASISLLRRRLASGRSGRSTVTTVAGSRFQIHVMFNGDSRSRWSRTLDQKTSSSARLDSREVVEKKGSGHDADFTVTVPADAKTTLAPSDVILPFPPPLVALALPVRYAGYEFTIHKAVQSTEAKTTGIFTYPLDWFRR